MFGYRYDTETGYYYLQSRYYNPEIGRFINADAAVGQVGSLLSHNMFQYCFNNPVNMDDPSGYWPKWATIAVVAVAVVAIAVVAVAAPAVSNAYYAASAAVTVAGWRVMSAVSNVVRGKPVSAAEVGETMAGKGQALSHPVLDNPRIGSALKNDIVKPIMNDKNKIVKEFPSIAKSHGFPDVIDNFARFADKFKTHDGADLWQILGSNNGVEGRFEWILDKGEITHRMSIEGGTFYGIPITP